MKVAQFTIPGPPKGKERPRVVSNGLRSTTYTPKGTVIYENYVKIMYQQQCRDVRFEEAVRAEIIGYFAVPKSASGKKQRAMLDGSIKYTKKIDCDNLAKAILDSLNGIAYRDDSQVCELIVRKLYGEEPKVVVRLIELTGNSS